MRPHLSSVTAVKVMKNEFFEMNIEISLKETFEFEGQLSVIRL